MKSGDFTHEPVSCSLLRSMDVIFASNQVNCREQAFTPTTTPESPTTVSSGVVSVSAIFRQLHGDVLDNYGMELDTIGEVIATRQLCLVDDPSREILVKIGKPQLSEQDG